MNEIEDRAEQAEKIVRQTEGAPALPDSEVGEPQTSAASAKKEHHISRTVLVWARDVLIALAVAIIVLQFIKPTIVIEHSMENTLKQNDYVFLSRQAYRFGEVEQGDIIAFHSSIVSDDGVEKNLIKRVIGLPGDKVEVRDGSVYVNGKKQNEDYTRDGYTAGAMSEVTVPKDSLFVLGDNRNYSRDSRDPDVGFVAEDQIIGKAFFRLYPLKEIGIIH
jgi:signal peptidase I